MEKQRQRQPFYESLLSNFGLLGESYPPSFLFSFESREARAPLGLVVLEGCTVELAEAPVPEEFAFTICFNAPGVRPYLLAADGPAAQEAWVKVLSRASFGYMRLVVRELENQLRDARQSLALHRHSSWKAGTSSCKTQPADQLSRILENGHTLSRDYSPMGVVEAGGSRPASGSVLFAFSCSMNLSSPTLDS
ncbi:PREDICTED: sesquipedalian-2-like [Myotis davidii]|uniref:sesquipedalian-2-like n=1 Tax=Myotis davidii TaxID=225400 RepID=UPI0003EC3531|nr:PREDICTED: sesquipedalian-2-like [Myotis davidii]